MKVCGKCNQSKPFGEFNKRKDSPDGYRGECRECNGIKCKNWYWNNRDYNKEKSREWQKNNPEKKKENWKRWKLENAEKAKEIQRRYRIKNFNNILLKQRIYRVKFREEINQRLRDKRKKYPDANLRQRLKFYGITLEQYDGMYEKQKGGCAICGKEYGRIALKVRHRLFVDHCHKTGAFRGLLCGKCNNAIGFLDDNIDRLKSAIKYLTPYLC